MTDHYSKVLVKSPLNPSHVGITISNESFGKSKGVVWIVTNRDSTQHAIKS